jgi:hypothetical protein
MTQSQASNSTSKSKSSDKKAHRKKDEEGKKSAGTTQPHEKTSEGDVTTTEGEVELSDHGIIGSVIRVSNSTMWDGDGPYDWEGADPMPVGESTSAGHLQRGNHHRNTVDETIGATTEDESVMQVPVLSWKQVEINTTLARRKYNEERAKKLNDGITASEVEATQHGEINEGTAGSTSISRQVKGEVEVDTFDTPSNHDGMIRNRETVVDGELSTVVVLHGAEEAILGKMDFNIEQRECNESEVSTE